MRFGKIRNLFKQGNVLVYGMVGTGKDVLFGNIIARNKAKYVANLDYTKDDRFIPFNPKDFDCGGNTYRDFIEGTIKPYTFPYPKGTHIYISDVGIYFPAQFCNELNRDYKYFPTFFALRRQLTAGGCIHTNTQAISRNWDKLREQSETYLNTNWCKVLFGGRLVIMKVTLYEKYESAVSKVPPFRLKLPMLHNKELKLTYDIQREKYRINYGKIKSGILIFRNLSKHDTYAFDKILKGEITNDEYKRKQTETA